MKVAPCGAIIEPEDIDRYKRCLLNITQHITARKRGHEAVTSSVENHQDELGEDLIEVRTLRRASASSSRQSEFVAFCPLLPVLGRPDQNIGDLPRSKILSYLGNSSRCSLACVSKFGLKLVRDHPTLPNYDLPTVVQIRFRSGSAFTVQFHPNVYFHHSFLFSIDLIRNTATPSTLHPRVCIGNLCPI